MALKPRIAITGSRGKIGKVLFRYFADHEYQVVGIDEVESDEGCQITADLCQYSQDWARNFDGCDAVIHLAANPDPYLDREVAERNHGIFCNVLRAAMENRVPRFIFASSTWVVAGHRFSRVPITTSMPARPVNPYGESKLRSELEGLRTCQDSPTTFIALRVGAFSPFITQPGAKMDQGSWGQALWLSARDLCSGFEAAATSANQGNLVLNLTSMNHPPRLDIAETVTKIGFRSCDGGRRQLSLKVLMTDIRARLALATGYTRHGWF